MPVFKKGDIEDPSNYRPISLLPAVSKVIEKLVKIRLLKFLNGINFFYKNQFGYRPKTGLDCAVFSIVSNIQDALDENKMVMG